MGDERNFRSQFYEKVGLRELEEKRAVEALLKEKPLDERKLAHFCHRSVVPAAYRTSVWKLLLRVTPRHVESQDYVRQQQGLMFEDLWHTLGSLGLAGPVGGGNGPLGAPAGSAEAPLPEHYVLMWLIGEAKLLHNPREQLRSAEGRRFLAVARKVGVVLGDPVDVFQASSSLWSLVLRNRQAIVDASQEAVATLRRENEALHRHLARVGLFAGDLLQDLCLGLFCDLLPETAVEKVLDKVISGAFRILAFVTVALLVGLRQQLASASTVDDVRGVLGGLRKEEAESVVNSALDQWLKVGLVKRVTLHE